MGCIYLIVGFELIFWLIGNWFFMVFFYILMVKIEIEYIEIWSREKDRIKMWWGYLKNKVYREKNNII